MEQQEDNTALHSVAPVPLDDYDYQRLDLKDTSKQERFHATYENAMEANE